MPTKQSLTHFSSSTLGEEDRGDGKRTPEVAVEILAPLLLKVLPPPLTFWEPTSWLDGNNPFTNVLSPLGYKVIETGMEGGQDFLTHQPDFEFDAIITNPPYSKKDAFIKRCYELGKPWFLLLPITALEGKGRWELYRQKGVSVLLPKGRIDFLGKGVWFYTAWFFWVPHIPSLNNLLLFSGEVD